VPCIEQKPHQAGQPDTVLAVSENLAENPHANRLKVEQIVALRARAPRLIKHLFDETSRGLILVTSGCS
jgi:hypothetical protein